MMMCCWLAACQTNGSDSITTLDAVAFNSDVQTKQNIQLIDVRTPQEFQSGHIDGALNINSAATDFENQLNNLNKEQPVYVYCKGGGRSAAAARKLAELGFKDIKDLKGGMMGYVAAGLAESKEGGMTVIQYDKIIAEHPYILIDFYADWCAPCKVMAPYIAKIEEESNGQLKVLKVNADENQALAEQLQVEGLPYLVLYKDQKKVWETLGLIKEDALREVIQQHQK